MKISFGRTVILVSDFDEALQFYQKAFGCTVLFDQTMPDGQRYLHIGFEADTEVGIWFLEGKNDQVGQQTGNAPTFVLYTDDIFTVFDHLEKENVEILSEISIVPDSKFFHCSDLYGNRIVVVEK